MQEITVRSLDTSNVSSLFRRIQESWYEVKPWHWGSLNLLSFKIWPAPVETHAFAVFSVGQFGVVVISLEYSEPAEEGALIVDGKATFGSPIRMSPGKIEDMAVKAIRRLLGDDSSPSRFISGLRLVICPHCGARYHYSLLPDEITCQNCSKAFTCQ
ncbi:MAG: hypothetical protein ACFFEF_02460 [Candidatus Thorarchaeota archaeon]